MKCAECGGPLSVELHGLFEDIEVQRCDACESGFYPRGTVDRLDDSLTVNAETLAFDEASAAPLPCPACVDSHFREQAGAPMRALQLPLIPPAAFHRCERCKGFWMPDATLDAFRRAALAQSTVDNASLNERATRRAEAKEREELKKKRHLIE